MSFTIYECEQGTPAWFAARLGIPTASEFATVMASGKGGAESKTRRKYLLQLAAERISGDPSETYSNAHMERGKVMEAEARTAYALITGEDPRPVGFIRSGDAGASPDSLVGDAGLLEIKSKLPHLHLEAFLAGVLPPDHKAQVQGQLWVAERVWCDFVSYWPKLPLFRVRVYRDEAYIANLAAAVAEFNNELTELTARITEAP